MQCLWPQAEDGLGMDLIHLSGIDLKQVEINNQDGPVTVVILSMEELDLMLLSIDFLDRAFLSFSRSSLLLNAPSNRSVSVDVEGDSSKGRRRGFATNWPPISPASTVTTVTNASAQWKSCPFEGFSP